MNTYGNNKPVNHLTAISRMGWYDETESEKESFVTSAFSTFIKTAGSVVSEASTAIVDATLDIKQEVTGTETKTEKNGKFSKGSIEFNRPSDKTKPEAQIEKMEKQHAEKTRKIVFNQTLKADQEKVQREKERVFEEEINDLSANLPTDQKNELLSYQASYKDKSVYQRAELRKKLIEQRQKQQQQQKAASIPSPAKQPSALEGAFEGRSGNQGSGTANLSAMATG